MVVVVSLDVVRVVGCRSVVGDRVPALHHIWWLGYQAQALFDVHMLPHAHRPVRPRHCLLLQGARQHVLPQLQVHRLCPLHLQHGLCRDLSDSGPSRRYFVSWCACLCSVVACSKQYCTTTAPVHSHKSHTGDGWNDSMHCIWAFAHPRHH
jgi:hypothetical protein